MVSKYHLKLCSATSNETGFSGNVITSLRNFFPGLTLTDMQQILNEYPESEFSSATERGITVIGDLEFRCGVSLEFCGNCFRGVSTVGCTDHKLRSVSSLVVLRSKPTFLHLGIATTNQRTRRQAIVLP